ncbi:MAG: hypothetical protein ACUVX8_07845 [Candidatus Zipacnadales bacterium]
MTQVLKTGSYEQQVATHLRGIQAVPEAPLTRVTLGDNGLPIIETDAGAFAFDGEKWTPAITCESPSLGPLPEPWRTYCADRQAVDLGRLGDQAAIVWFHNELLLIGADGHSEVLLKGFPAPLREFHCGSVAPDGTVWLGSRQGAVCLRKGKWQYYAGPRYLLSDEVITLAADAEGGAWIATPLGMTHISRRTLTLAEKADLFEQQIRARHCREGYVASCRLAAPGDLSHYTHEASDNDGLWTALYVAAECFRYAVTGSDEAKRWAWESTQALLDLERRTPLAGLPARACVRVGEEVIKSSGEWHLTETYHAPGRNEPGPSPDGAWEWKGDTSSDELDGHYFALSIYYDLVADNAQKQEIREVIERITDHLVNNDFLLIDIDGRPTRWGVFSPRFLNCSWEAERGLNSLSILSHLRVAHHICGHKRYLEAARDLIEKHHYALNTINQKIMPPGDVNHSDDELAFICYYPLLTYETDPDLRQLFLLSLERSWRIERQERNPLWNFIYGALSHNPCDVEAAVQTLAEIPLDMVNWPVRNSHRIDIVCAPHTGRFGEVECLDPLPADERPIARWNANPYRLDGGGDGCSEEDATHYLLPYWLGRYHRLIE